MTTLNNENNIAYLVQKLKDPKHSLLRKSNRLKKKRRNKA